MSLATARASEIVGRNVEKLPIHKHIPGPHSHAALNTATADVSSYDDALHRDSSPHLFTAPRRPDSCESEQQSTGLISAKAEGAELGVRSAEAQPAVARRPPLDLDVCPSFSEQQPRGTKPLFLDRHHTLQLVHQSQQSGAYSSNSATNTTTNTPSSNSTSSTSSTSTSTSIRGSPEGAAASTSPCSPASSHPPPLASCLPSWDIARSELWMLAQAALLNIQPPGAPGKDTTAATAAAAATTTTAVAVAATSGTSGGAVPKTPFACLFTQTSVTQQAPGLHGLFRKISSIQRRTCPATPRGMGPIPTLLTPSFTLSSLAAARPSATSKSQSGPWATADAAAADAATEVEALQALELDLENLLVTEPAELPPEVTPTREVAAEAGSSAADMHMTNGPERKQTDGENDGNGDELDALHPHHHRKHHAAFAAGVAAATSTAAAVSHTAAAAAAGLAGLASQASSGSSMLMHLAENGLNVGGSVVLTKLQGMIMNTSTMVAAEVVLGHDAPVALRRRLHERLRCTLAGASVMWFLLNLHSTCDMLAHLDFEHDFITSSKVVLNLATSGPTLIKNCQELLQLGLAVSAGVGKRAMWAGGAELITND